MHRAPLTFIDLGRVPYARAYEVQLAHVEAVLAARDQGTPEVGRVLLVEHEPVITISRRAGAEGHLLATTQTLEKNGVEVAHTDRGGDITYHGPGQLVAYPILDLNLLNLGLHAYMRLLEGAVIDTCAAFGVQGFRDPGATGVWVERDGAPGKIAAMGVRVRRWVSMHGLSLNVDPVMEHYDLIVPCGLIGRRITSLRAEVGAMGGAAPAMAEVSRALCQALENLLREAEESARTVRAASGGEVTGIPQRIDQGST